MRPQRDHSPHVENQCTRNSFAVDFVVLCCCQREYTELFQFFSIFPKIYALIYDLF